VPNVARSPDAVRFTKRTLRRALLPLASLGGLTLTSSCFAVGVFRYGIPNMKSGDYGVGDRAPKVELVSLDGETSSLEQHLAGRPLVLVFGSFT